MRCICLARPCNHPDNFEPLTAFQTSTSATIPYTDGTLALYKQQAPAWVVAYSGKQPTLPLQLCLQYNGALDVSDALGKVYDVYSGDPMLVVVGSWYAAYLQVWVLMAVELVDKAFTPHAANQSVK